VAERDVATHPYRLFNPLLPERDAHALVALCERHGAHGLYSEEGLNSGIGEGLPQRFDSALNFVRTGGRFARTDEDRRTLAARTNYFRETYAYGDEIRAPGIEAFLRHEGFVDAAREVHGRMLIEPVIVFANLLIPGQELAVHTDVPEFRGANRRIFPQWLLVVMHHARLFARWHMPIATGVAWFHDANGGEFAFYPGGADGASVALPVRFNTAIVTDTDSVFHGVDRVHETALPIPPLRPGMKLVPEGDGVWAVRGDGETLARYRWPELRFSVSWKAYCFADEAECTRWRDHRDDVSLETVLAALERDLRARGELAGPLPERRDFAKLLVDTYVRFPKPETAPC
jgi:hypothetical protein